MPTFPRLGHLPAIVFGPTTDSRRAEVRQSLESQVSAGRDYVLLALLSCIIATFGLVLDSPAVVIGAMLIAPLMPVILALSLAAVQGRPVHAARALATLLTGALLVVGFSACLSRLITLGEVNFLEQLPAEVLARTRPTLFDLVVALAGGAAAAYAVSRPKVSAALPGVAIATAIVPPLCVIGVGLAQGRSDVSIGALFLFLANFVAILFASFVVFACLGFGPTVARRGWRGLMTNSCLTVALLLPVGIPLIAFLGQIAADGRDDQVIHAVLTEHLRMTQTSSLVGIERHWEGDHLSLIATIRASRALTYGEALAIQRAIAERIEKPTALKLLVVPQTSLDTLIPPTRTPQPLSTVGDVAVAALPSPTATAWPTPTDIPTARPSPTTPPSPTATATVAPSSTPSPSPSPTATPLAYALTTGTEQRGVNVRRNPDLAAAVIEIAPDDTLVQLTGESSEQPDGSSWVRVVLADGRVGWIADSFLVPYQAYRPPQSPGQPLQDSVPSTTVRGYARSR